MTRSRLVLLALLAAAAIAFVVERLVVTDREAISATIEGLGKSVSRGDWVAFESAIDDDYSERGLDKRAFVDWASRLWKSTGSTRVDVEVGDTRVEGERASARVDVVVSPWNRRVTGRVDLVRRGEDWRVTGATPDDSRDLVR